MKAIGDVIQMSNGGSDQAFTSIDGKRMSYDFFLNFYVCMHISGKSTPNCKTVFSFMVQNWREKSTFIQGHLYMDKYTMLVFLCTSRNLQ